MRVLVTGAYGLIGAACLARLDAAGHEVVAAGRNIGVARRRAPYAQWVAADFSTLATAEAWLPLLHGVDAVVNCVGVLQDGLRDDVRRVQLDGTTALFDGCVRAGVRRVVHISAIGIAPDGPSAFAQQGGSRGLPARVRARLGDPAPGAGARVRGLWRHRHAARHRRLSGPGAGGACRCAHAGRRPGRCCRNRHTRARAGHGRKNRLGNRPSAGAPPRRHRHSDRRLARLSAAARGCAAGRDRRRRGATGGRARLARVAEPGAFDGTGAARRRRGRRSGALDCRDRDPPKSFAEILAARPASAQDRWFARLYLLKPLAILGLTVAAIVPSAAALAFVLGPRIVEGSLPVSAAVVVQSVVHLLAGLGLLVRPAARCPLLVLAGADALRLTGPWAAPSISFLWSLNAATFLVPMPLAVLFTLGILDDR